MKAGHKTNMIRFDIELNPVEIGALESILEQCHRNRKSFGEALVKITLNAHAKGNRYVDISELGIIKINHNN